MNRAKAGVPNRKQGAILFVEGGGKNEALHDAVRRGLRLLLESCGYKGCMPHIVACGPRDVAHDRFKTAHQEGKAEFVALLVDSEDKLTAGQTLWEHLESRKDNKLLRPAGATEEQLFLMTTSMETWIAADPVALAARYGDKFQASALPSKQTIEARRRDDVFDDLVHATRNCGTGYAKGRHSFDLLGKLDPCALYVALPSFRRMIGILDGKLGCPHIPCPGEEADAASDSA